jgi:U6 snRNA-associated Sm-like protein LSm7
LKGYDPLLNLVLDDTIEYQKGKKRETESYLGDKLTLSYIIDLETGYITETTRQLGLSVLRGTAVILISPFDGMEEIENPFAQ